MALGLSLIFSLGLAYRSKALTTSWFAAPSP